MNNNVVDKVYLALELTRLYVEHKSETKGIFGISTIKDTFEYYVKELTGIENLDNYSKLEKELEEITEKYNDLRENMETAIEDRVDYKKDALKHILENAKGDMEPYVYESLTNLLK